MNSIMDAKTSNKVNIGWAGIILIEATFTASAFYVATLIMACAGLWHEQSSLSLDLIKYFGSTLSRSGRIARDFGCSKTVANLAIAVVIETAQIKLAKLYLHETSSEGTLAEGIMILGSLVRIVMYIGPVVFSHSRRLYVWPDEWAFETEYAKLATHCRTWTAFWLILSLALMAIIMDSFALQKNNLEIVLCLIVIVVLVGIGAYLNDAEPLREALEAFATGIEWVGEIYFG